MGSSAGFCYFCFVVFVLVDIVLVIVVVPISNHFRSLLLPHRQQSSPRHSTATWKVVPLDSFTESSTLLCSDLLGLGSLSFVQPSFVATGQQFKILVRSSKL